MDRPTLVVELQKTERLRFDDGSPVCAASAIVGFDGGWLVAQDDANHAAWIHRSGRIEPFRLLAPTLGLDRFSEAEGTKHLKADFEAACAVHLPDGTPAALFLGSGSTAQRMRAVVVAGRDGVASASPADLTPLYHNVIARLDIEHSDLNLEGAALHGTRLHWFNRGNPYKGVPSQSVMVDIAALLANWDAPGRLSDIDVRTGSVYELGELNGVGLAVTDAIALGGDHFLLSAAAEDTPNTIDDGPVTGSVLALADAAGVTAIVELPMVEGAVCKVEGLAVAGVDTGGRGATVLAVVDADAVDEPSLCLTFAVTW